MWGGRAASFRINPHPLSASLHLKWAFLHLKWAAGSVGGAAHSRSRSGPSALRSCASARRGARAPRSPSPSQDAADRHSLFGWCYISHHRRPVALGPLGRSGIPPNRINSTPPYRRQLTIERVGTLQHPQKEGRRWGSQIQNYRGCLHWK